MSSPGSAHLHQSWRSFTVASRKRGTHDDGPKTPANSGSFLTLLTESGQVPEKGSDLFFCNKPVPSAQFNTKANVFPSLKPSHYFSMPRAHRIILPNYPHHVIHRGHNRSLLFSSEVDFKVYLENLAELKSECGCLIHAFCLMTNHVHLIVTPKDRAESLSRFMKKVAGRYTGYMNATYSRTGTAWNGRFKSNPIQTNRYLLTCSRYVELNPVRAGIVARPHDYRWSSFSDRIGVHRIHWLDEDPCYKELGGNRRDREAGYAAYFLRTPSDSDQRHIREAIQKGYPLGDDGFHRHTELTLGIRIRKRDQGRPKLKLDLQAPKTDIQ